MSKRALPLKEMMPRLAPPLAADKRPLWHKAAVAGAGHGVLLVLVLWVAKTHLPPPAPEPVTITLVAQSMPEGAKLAQPAPVQPPQPAPVPTSPAAAPLVPLAEAADLPLPPPPAPPDAVGQMQAATPSPHPSLPPAPKRQAAGAKIKAARLASATVALLHPAVALADNQAPDYPLVARLAGEKGTVRFQLYLDATGAVTRFVMTQSSGFALLDDSVRSTALTWRYRPALRQGVAVASVVPFHVTFEPQ